MVRDLRLLAPLSALIALGATVGPAGAQYDPMASRAESTVNSLQRSLTVQQQDRASAQQNQFEVNSLRNAPPRPAAPPPPVAPGFPIRR